MGVSSQRVWGNSCIEIGIVTSVTIMRSTTIKIWLFITATLCALKGFQTASSRLRKVLLSSDWLNDIDGDNIPGQAGVDYPVYSSVPTGTSFRCRNYEYAGYFADPEADCQAYHVCFPDGRNASFLCVNGTVFHQRYYVCDWWFHSNCSLAPELYELNLYRKIPLPVLPPVKRREFPGPAPQPRVELPPPPPRQREPKRVRDDQKNDRRNDRRDRKEENERKDKDINEKKKTKANSPVSPYERNQNPQNRNSGHDNSCNCQCSGPTSMYAASEVRYHEVY